MSIFDKKDKAAADALPTAGCGGLNCEQYEAAYEGFLEIDNETRQEKFFNYGFLAGLAFVSCPESAETHGESALEFAENAFAGAWRDELTREMNAALTDAAKSVIEQYGIDADVTAIGEINMGDDA